jgi:hypothetical protein
MCLFARSVLVAGFLLFFLSVSGLDADANAGDPPATIFENGFEAFSCSQTEPIELVNLGGPPDLLIVLDRSGSMSSPIPTFPPNFTPKWTIMRDALNGLAGSYEDSVRFGLLEFPTDDDCAVAAGTAVRVPVDLGQAPEIASYFQSRSPNGNTPAQFGLAVALSYYQSIPVNPVGRYVLFATDGEPNCSLGDPAAETVAAVTAPGRAAPLLRGQQRARTDGGARLDRRRRHRAVVLVRAGERGAGSQRGNGDAQRGGGTAVERTLQRLGLPPGRDDDHLLRQLLRADRVRRGHRCVTRARLPGAGHRLTQ